MRLAVWLVLVAGCPNEPTPEQLNCTQLRLRPGRQGAVELGVASTALPSVAIDLRGLSGIDHVTVTLSSCAGVEAASLVHKGGRSFLLDDAWYRKNAPARCHRLSAVTWDKTGGFIGSDSARVRSGDYSVWGDVKEGVRPLPAHVRVELDDLTFESDGTADGHFAFDHLPGGMVWRVAARELVVGNRLSRRAELSPKAHLDAINPSLQLHLVAVAGPLPVDSFEPDDTVTAVAGRAPLLVGDDELHALPDKRDVDIIPVGTLSANRYRATLTPLDAVDLSLQVIDASGSVLAHANDTPADFAALPSITFTAGANALYLRVARNDDESTRGAYRVSFARVGVGP
jgi:hypothetical protein